MHLSKFIHIAISFVLGIFAPSAVFVIPKKIGQFTWVKDMSPDKAFPYKIALFKRKNQFAVAKIWQGTRSDVHYYTLKQEITNYQVVTQLIARLKTKIPEIYKKIYLPEFIQSEESKNVLVLFLEYIPDTESIGLWPVPKQQTAYITCVNYLRFLGSNCTLAEKHTIRVKGIRYFLLLYPFLLLAALIKSPLYAVGLLQGIIVVLKTIPQLLRFRAYTLVHGDLHAENIRNSPKGLVIMDLEQMMFSYPAIEMIATLSTKRMTEAFRADLFDRMILPLQKDAQFYKLFRCLLVICSTYNLTWTSEAKNREIYGKLLALGLQGDVKKNAKANRIRPALFVKRYV